MPLLHATTLPVTRYWRAQCTTLSLPLIAGIIVFGWRGLIAVALVLGGAMAVFGLWRLAGRPWNELRPMHTLWLGLLTACLVPADPIAVGGWIGAGVLLACGVLTALLAWLLGGIDAGNRGIRVQPSVLVSLAATVGLGSLMTPTLVLERRSAVLGDLADVAPEAPGRLVSEPWLSRNSMDNHAATVVRPAGAVLKQYTRRTTTETGEEVVGRRATMASVLRDRMPLMEDLIILGHPRRLGMASVIALIAAGMFLLYRGISDVRVTILTLVSAYAAFALLPVPAVVSTEGGGAIWTWGLGLGGVGEGARHVGWDVGLTFVHYEMLAGSVVFIAMVLAPVPSVRPLVGKWRVLWALMLGPAMVVAQRYLGAQIGPMVALLILTLLCPLTDRLVKARPLIK